MNNRNLHAFARVLPIITALTLTGTLPLAQAGIVTSTTANMPHSPEGFGAWNLDNVTVTVNGGGMFNPADGSYTVGDGTFDSAVDDTGPAPVLRTGVVHGKDWPVGEPSGIKAKNDDMAVKQGKPTNCLMTTSYLELSGDPNSGYLDTANPVQTLCSSGFQTHKRFKVNMESNSLLPGGAVDLVFNIEPDGTTRDYQVFQKINNYTDSRLDGFSVQVGVGVGSTFQTASAAGLTGSLWLSVPGSIWDPEDVATFSHGLFGPADKHFPEDGFFDSQRAGFFTAITEYVMGSGIGDEFHSTTTQGSNYAQVPPTTGPASQFGPWLPSIWTPQGVFFDDDGDPSTDAVLMAFWGETAAASGVFAWMQGDADNFATVPQPTIDGWAADPAYSVGTIEDLLNLGLNYMVTIGTVDGSFPDWDGTSATFTIRIIPEGYIGVIGAPTYVANPPPPFVPPSSAGTVSVTPSPAFVVSQNLVVGVADPDLNTNNGVVETVDVTVENLTNGEMETLTLTEIAADRGTFEATMDTAFGAAPNGGAGIINVLPGEEVELTYNDADDGTGNPATVTASTFAAAGTTGQLTATASINPGNNITLSVTDADLNVRSTAIDFATVSVVNDVTGENELVSLEETGANTDVFTLTLATASGNVAGADNDAVMNVKVGDTLTTTYLDSADNTGAPATVTDATTVTAAPVASTSSSSGGGSCSLVNPDGRFNPTMPLLLAVVMVFGWLRRQRKLDG